MAVRRQASGQAKKRGRAPTKRTTGFNLGEDVSLASEMSLADMFGTVIVVTAQGCDSVSPRKGKVRKLVGGNMLRLATSLAEGAVVPPIGIDPGGTLVFGAHRLAAARMLATPASNRLAFVDKLSLETPLTEAEVQLLLHLPHKGVVELRADTVQGVMQEIYENSNRRQLTPELVREQLDLLIDAGYEVGAGPAKAGGKGKAMVKLAEAWGVSNRALQLQLQKGVKQGESAAKVQEQPEPEKYRKRLLKALAVFLVEEKGRRTGSVQKSRKLAQQLIETIEEGHSVSVPKAGNKTAK